MAETAREHGPIRTRCACAAEDSDIVNRAVVFLSFSFRRDRLVLPLQSLEGSPAAMASSTTRA